MPIYEYACRSCEHQFESIQKASEAPLRDCPECGEATLKKLLSVPVFRLKGSGWYETDFKTGDKRNVVETGDAGEAGKDADAAKGEAGADKKAADKDAGKGGGAEASGSGSSRDKAESKQGANGDAKPAKAAAKNSGDSSKPTKPASSKG